MTERTRIRLLGWGSTALFVAGLLATLFVTGAASRWQAFFVIPCVWVTLAWLRRRRAYNARPRP